MAALLSGGFLQSLSATEAAFFWIGVVSGGFLLFQIVFSAVGIFETGNSQKAPFSLKSVTSFLCAGAFCAFFAAKYAALLWLPYPVFVLSGGVAFAFTETLARLWRKKFFRNPKSRFTGADAVVILTVPPERKGKGKVTLLLGEEYEAIDAVTDERTAIPAGAPVKIVFYSERYVVVARLEKTKIGKAEFVSPRASESGSGVHSE